MRRLTRISGSRARTSMSNWMARFWTPKHDKTCVERSVSNGDDAGMGRQLIRTDLAPGSSLYSQGVRVGDHICVSGMTGTDPATGDLAGGTIQVQTRQAIANCLAILEAGGAGYDDIVEVGILLTNPADFARLNEEYARAFPTDPPARYVAKLGVELPGVLVSIRMTAITS